MSELWETRHAEHPSVYCECGYNTLDADGWEKE
jgi:hypothetical protein